MYNTIFFLLETILVISAKLDLKFIKGCKLALKKDKLFKKINNPEKVDNTTKYNQMNVDT